MNTKARGFGLLAQRRRDAIQGCKQNFVEMAQQCEAEGDYVAAEAVWMNALEFASDLRETYFALEHLAYATHLNGRTHAAIVIFGDCLVKLSEHLGESHPRCAGVINQMAAMYFFVGDLDNARTLCLEALRIYQMNYGCGHKSWLEVYSNLNEVEKEIKRRDAYIPETAYEATVEVSVPSRLPEVMPILFDSVTVTEESPSQELTMPIAVEPEHHENVLRIVQKPANIPFAQESDYRYSVRGPRNTKVSIEWNKFCDMDELNRLCAS